MKTIYVSLRAFILCLACGITAPLFASSQAGPLVLNERGGYWFQPGLPFLSFSVRAADGYEIVRATFRSPRPFSQGIEDIKTHLLAAGRPLHALCGLEIRSADPGSGAGIGFGAFNSFYMESMKAADLLVDGASPLIRVNVSAPNVSEHCLFGFTYTVLVSDGQTRPPTFMTCAFPEAINIRTKPELVAKGDTSPAGLQKKMEVVLAAVDDSLQQLGTRWADVTGVQMYSVYDLHPLYEEFLAPRLGDVARRGVEWYFARPPVVGNDLEIAVRGIRREELIED